EVEPRYDAGLPLLPVSVNFSRQDFDYIDIPKELDRIVEEYHIEQFGIDKSYFIVEITEQDMAVGTENFYKQLDEIRKSGYQLWIDDFGSGYSSLNIFSRFDVDLVNFDMELLKDLNRHNGANREIIKAMIGVAKKLGIHTLCEGMETEEQKEFLKAAGCELAQGFLYHKPEPLDTIFDRLKIGIPIPKWETTEERKKREKMWTSPM
ncbi:MAG: EAL domain-containing protein, partial [Lachnospiraceae bacterium]|nr:EAL domain-containing protein [Lachnospiraceae bacterium]